MKYLSLILLFLSSQALASYTIRINQTVDPDPKSVKQAQALLGDAIADHEKNDVESYREKLRQAANLIEVRTDMRSLVVDIIVRVDNHDITGNEWDIVAALDDGQDHVCYEGKGEDFVTLINYGTFDFETSGLTEASVKGENVLATLFYQIDHTKEVEMKPCN